MKEIGSSLFGHVEINWYCFGGSTLHDGSMMKINTWFYMMAHHSGTACEKAIRKLCAYLHCVGMLMLFYIVWLLFIDDIILVQNLLFSDFNDLWMWMLLLQYWIYFVNEKATPTLANQKVIVQQYFKVKWKHYNK